MPDPEIGQGRTATADGSNGAQTPDLAVDGNNATYWQSLVAAAPHWIQVDLGAVYKVTRVRVNWDANYGKNYSFKVSNDPTFATSTMLDQKMNNNAAGWDDHPSLSDGSGRYVRMTCTSMQSTSISLLDFEVYGFLWGDRDFYFQGAVDGEGAQDGNWVGATGTAMPGYPGDGGGRDRAFFHGAIATRAMSTFSEMNRYWERGAEMDLAYATAYPAATLQGTETTYGTHQPALRDSITLYGAALLFDTQLGAQNDVTEMDLHGTSGVSADYSQNPMTALTIHAWDGAHQYYNANSGMGGANAAPTVVLHNISGDLLPSVTINPPANYQGWNGFVAEPSYEIQDSVQPDVSRVLENVVFGVPGHTKTGKLVVLGSGGSRSKLGYECKLYRNAGTYSAEDWQEITPVKDVTLNLEKGEVDATTRANGGWKASLGALKEGSVEFDIVWDVTDEGFQALLDSYVNDTPVELAVMDGLIQSPGAQGLRATMTVLKFTRVEGLEEAVVANVVVKPTLADHAPEWMVVPD